MTETDAILRLEVAPGDDGRPLLDLVATALGDAAVAAMLIAHGGLWVDGVRISDASAPARAGAALALHRPPGGVYPEVALTGEEIRYEDDDLLALDKPAGVYVVPTPWDTQGNLLAALGRFLTERDGHAPPLHPAHRLDRDTTGVLLFSKNPAANPALQAAFGGPQRAGVDDTGGGEHARKEYLCLCLGEPTEDSFTIETGHGRERHGRFRVYPAEEIGRELPGGARVKAMRTRFEVERRLGDAALVRAYLATGRTHQIRLHLAHLGHPLLGDARYGGPATWRGQPIPHHLLHAERLELPHPRTGAWLALTAPLPAWARWPDGEG